MIRNAIIQRGFECWSCFFRGQIKQEQKKYTNLNNKNVQHNEHEQRKPTIQCTVFCMCVCPQLQTDARSLCALLYIYIYCTLHGIHFGSLHRLLTMKRASYYCIPCSQCVQPSSCLCFALLLMECLNVCCVSGIAHCIRTCKCV